MGIKVCDWAEHHGLESNVVTDVIKEKGSSNGHPNSHIKEADFAMLREHFNVDDSQPTTEEKTDTKTTEGEAAPPEKKVEPQSSKKTIPKKHSAGDGVQSVVANRKMKLSGVVFEPGDLLGEVRLSEGVDLITLGAAIHHGSAGAER